MIKRKFIFIISIIFMLTAFVLFKSDIGTSLQATLAVNQVSDNIAINSLARTIATSGVGIDTLSSVMFLLSCVGILFSLVPKKEKKNEN